MKTNAKYRVVSVITGRTILKPTSDRKKAFRVCREYRKLKGNYMGGTAAFVYKEWTGKDGLDYGDALN